jgi:hypothetical protein
MLVKVDLVFLAQGRHRQAREPLVKCDALCVPVDCVRYFSRETNQ